MRQPKQSEKDFRPPEAPAYSKKEKKKKSEDKKTEEKPSIKIDARSLEEIEADSKAKPGINLLPDFIKKYNFLDH